MKKCIFCNKVLIDEQEHDVYPFNRMEKNDDNVCCTECHRKIVRPAQIYNKELERYKVDMLRRDEILKEVFDIVSD